MHVTDSPMIATLGISSVSRASLFACSRRRLASQNVIELGAKLDRAYKLMGLQSTCTKEELKSKYLSLVKAYHPDTGSEKANVDKFQAVRDAYKLIVDNDYGEQAKEELEDLPQIFDIRHTAPQHRQYLEYGGIGMGTPFQRQQQHQKYRVRKASENVQEYMIGKIMGAEQSDTQLAVQTRKDAEYARRWKTRNAMDRLVEDLIQESMNKGDFDRLPGSGKPLNHDPSNPYIDTMTQKVNKILIQNGFTPEWCLMEKEIRQSIRDIRQKLLRQRCSLPYEKDDWSPSEIRQWEKCASDLDNDCANLNKRIDHYNLVVPALSRQIVQLTSARELRRLENELQPYSETGYMEADTAKESATEYTKPPERRNHEEKSLKSLYYDIFS